MPGTPDQPSADHPERAPRGVAASPLQLTWTGQGSPAAQPARQEDVLEPRNHGEELVGQRPSRDKETPAAYQGRPEFFGDCPRPRQQLMLRQDRKAAQ